MMKVINIFLYFVRKDTVVKKKIKQGLVNPVARDMLRNRKSPQVVAPKRGKGAKYNRGVSKKNAIHNEEF